MGRNWRGMKNCSAHLPKQQQQQNIVEEQQRPTQSSITRAWGDRSAGNELIEERDNEFCVALDNNSLSSGRTSSVRISFTSPGSSTSQDSTLMPGTSYEYNSRSVCNDCKLHEKPEPHQEGRVEGQENKSMDAQSSITESSSNIQVTQNIVMCPICSFNSTDRKIFIEHLSSHNLTRTNMELIENVLRQLRSLQNEENRTSAGQEGEKKEEENQDISVPRLNSQGRIKTFRCKQCDHVAITKTQFWAHSRIHIRLEKIINCPKCPFVTEYKHHLEYHMRNHAGSKPFKCAACRYTCVNKSMLNSHMKSHSNVYQYRCANCTYATKYCHSLKLHLRKYLHQPAVVLNADGTPNSGSVYIDIYGTKRGPKKKPKPCTETNDDSNQNSVVPSCSNNIVNNVQSSLLQSSLVQPSLVQPSFFQPGLVQPNLVQPSLTLSNLVEPGFVQSSRIQEGTLVLRMIGSSIGDRSGANSERWSGLNQTRPIMDHTHLLATFNLTNETHKYGALHKDAQSTNGENHMSREVSEIKAAFNLNTNTFDSDLSYDEVATEKTSSFMELKTQPDITSNIWINKALIEENKPEDLPNVPLDLSKPSNSKVHTSHFQQTTINSPKVTGTRKRKGIAVKLEHRVMEEDTDEETIQKETELCMPSASDAQDPQGINQNHDENNQTQVAKRKWFGKDYVCPYCDIAFGNEVMYVVHMGYHGYNAPYTCNKCGEKCSNNLSFFLHINRSQHIYKC